jgi:hypothetical protein
MRFVLVLSALLSFATGARADAIGAGVGSRTCGQFAADYRANQNIEAVYNNWALGYMTGMNVILEAVSKPTRNLEAMPFEEKKSYMRSYCDSHPLRNFMDGATELFGAFPIMR